MKYFVGIFSAIVLALCFTGCGDKEEDTAVVEDTSVDAGSDTGSDTGEDADASAEE